MDNQIQLVHAAHQRRRLGEHPRRWAAWVTGGGTIGVARCSDEFLPVLPIEPQCRGEQFDRREPRGAPLPGFQRGDRRRAEAGSCRQLLLCQRGRRPQAHEQLAEWGQFLRGRLCRVRHGRPGCWPPRIV